MESIDTARGRKESGRLAVSAKEEALGFTALAITLLSLINSLILPRGMQSRIYEYITQEKKQKKKIRQRRGPHILVRSQVEKSGGGQCKAKPTPVNRIKISESLKGLLSPGNPTHSHLEDWCETNPGVESVMER